LRSVLQLDLAARLAWAYLCARPLATVLNVLMLALGVATIVSLLLLGTQLESRSERDRAGIDLVVGAKGSPLQLVLSSVYHLDVPVGNVPMEAALKATTTPLIRHAVPISLGDSYRQFRIVGADERFDALYGLRVAVGARARRAMQATLGAEAARATGLAPGMRFAGGHGLGGQDGAHDDTPFEVSGVFAPTGSVADRLILTPLESVWMVHAPPKHVEGSNAGSAAALAMHDGSHDPGRAAPEPSETREVTAVLVQYATPLAAARLPREINAASALQAASPAAELARLFGFLGLGAAALKAFAAMMVALAAAGIFVSLSGAFASRAADLALMRLLGAARPTVAATLLFEGTLVGVAGVILGVALGHAAIGWLGAGVAGARDLALSGAAWAHGEAWAVLGALCVALAASIWPAWRAYRRAVPQLLTQF
jgi:putative ABC transport system permease protein